MVSEKIVPGLKGQRRPLCASTTWPVMWTIQHSSMILLMERASISAIQHLLEPDQTSVGYEVNVRHLAPASIGARIIAYSELSEVQRNRLSFKVEAYDGETKIGDGTHRRAIISTESSGC